MKPIALIIILFINISTKYLDHYSINFFIIRLKSEGLFEIIKSIKIIYGQDVAIISCEELNKNTCGNCKRVVLDYMPLQSHTPTPTPHAPIPKDIQKEGKEKDTKKKDLKIQCEEPKHPTIQNILNNKFDQKNSKLISDGIRKKVKIIFKKNIE